MAADATGMNRTQALRYVVMPQALRIILPPLTSEFMSIVKNSSLALTIGVLELTAQSRQIENFTFHGFEAFGRRDGLLRPRRACSQSGHGSPAADPGLAGLRCSMPDFSLIVRNAGFLFDGLLLSLTLTLIGVIGGLAVGTALALVRLFTGCIGNRVVDVYVFLFRAIR